MRARALICDQNQSFTIEEVVLPDPGPDQIAVRTHYSGVSIGTEFALIRGKLSWGPYPICTGYQGVGVVAAVGSAVAGFRPGDRVYFRGSKAMALPDGRSVTCVSGVHCSHAVLQPGGTHGADHLPPGVPLDVGSLFVMPAVGLHGVDMANPHPGDAVVVYGVGLVGLGVVAACAYRGCVVIAVDINPTHLDLARKLGADHLIDASKQNVPAAVERLAPQGADVVFECTGLPECLDPAIALCREHAVFVWQGNYGAAPIPFSFLPAHLRQLTMVMPCDDGLQPCRRAVLRSIALGALRWDLTITHRVEPADAPALYDRINRGDAGDVIGAVVHWSD